MSDPLSMRTITLTFTGEAPATPVEVNCQVAEVVIDDEPGDETRYDVLCEDTSYVTNSPSTPTLQIRGLQLWGTDGLARLLWDALGTDVGFAYAPFGNAPATADEPQWSGSIRVNRRPQVGGEVGTFAEVDVEYPITVGPTMGVGGAAARDASRDTVAAGRKGSA